MNKKIVLRLLCGGVVSFGVNAGWLDSAIYSSFYHKRIQDPAKRVSGYPFITGDTFRTMANHICDETNLSFDPQAVAYGDIIFVSAQIDIVKYFFQKYHAQIMNPYILITHNEDTSLPGPLAPYLDDPKLLRWFAQNSDRDHPKLTAIPIGFSNPVWGEGGKTSNYLDAVKSIPLPETRSNKIYMNFDVTTNPNKRRPIWELFKNKPFVHAASRVSYRQHLEELKKFRFVISPPGNGVDCHRPWEALLMGCIPIMRHSSVDVLFDGLPVIFVNEWSDVTADFIAQQYEILKMKPCNREKIFFDYWANLIFEFQCIARRTNSSEGV